MNVFSLNRNTVQSMIQWSAGPSLGTIRPKLESGSSLSGAEIRFMERQSCVDLDPSDRSQYGRWKRERFAWLQEKIKEGDLLTPIETEQYEAWIATHIFDAHDEDVFRKWENQLEPTLERNLEEARQNKLRNKELAKPRMEEEGAVKRPNPSRKVRIIEPIRGTAGGGLPPFFTPYGRRNG